MIAKENAERHSMQSKIHKKLLKSLEKARISDKVMELTAQVVNDSSLEIEQRNMMRLTYY